MARRTLGVVFRGWLIALAAAASFSVAIMSIGAGPLAVYDSALPSTLNPLYARSMVDRRVHELIFDRLYWRSAITSEVRSRLVAKGTALSDGLQWKMNLVPGLTWSDGESLGPEDVCFTVRTLLDVRNGSPVAAGFRDVLASCSVEKKDNSATVTFTRPLYNPADRLSFHVLPAHVFDEELIAPDHAFSTRPTGSGAMQGNLGRREIKLTARRSVQHPSALAEMIVSEGGDPLVQVRTLLNGGVHGLISVAPPLRTEVAASDEVALKGYDLQSWWFAALNPRTLTKDMRAALDLSLDRWQLRELTMGFDPEEPSPACVLISGPFVPSSPFYNRAIRVAERSDMAGVRRQMTAAGATMEVGRWVRNGRPVDLRIGMMSSLDVEARDLLNQVGNQLQAAGFGRNVFRVSTDDWNTRVLTGQMADEADVLIGKWSFGAAENVNALFETRHGGLGSLNIFGFSDPTVDKLVGNYNAARTDTEAANAYHELHRSLADSHPYLFLWKLDTRSAWRNEVQNNVISPYWYFTEFDGWTLR